MINKKELAAGVASAAALAAAATGANAADLGNAGSEFDGFYAGVSAGLMSGDSPIVSDGDETYRLKGVSPGAFLGFNSQNGNLVLGAEAALTGPTSSKEGSGDSYGGHYGLNYTLDAKAKAGLAFGNAMVYGFAGASSQSLNGNGGGNYTAYGVNFGGGLDLKVSDHVIVGVEYTERRLRGSDEYDQDSNAFSNRTYSLRAAYAF